MTNMRKVVDHFLNVKLKKISDLYVIKPNVVNPLAFIDRSNPATVIPVYSPADDMSFLSQILNISEDPYLNTDILMTNWLVRRRAEYNEFFLEYGKIAGKSGAESINDAFAKFKIKIGQVISLEHVTICRLIDASIFYLREQHFSQDIAMGDEQKRFLYMYLIHNYKVIQMFPLAWSEFYLPKILNHFHSLKNKFFFATLDEMDFKMKRDSNNLLTSFLSDSMSIQLVVMKRNHLFSFYCSDESLYPHNATIPAEI